MCAETVDIRPGENTIDITRPFHAEEEKKCFFQMMEEPLRQAAEIGQADIVVGIPFYNETETIATVVQTIRQGLQEFYPDRKAIITAIGLPAGSECLEIIKQIPQSETIRHIAFLRDDERIQGKGWAILAAMEIARLVNADLAIFEADLRSVEQNGEVQGLTPRWVHLLLEPVKREDMDLVISRFNRNCLESPIASFVVYPLLTAIYNCPIHDPLGGQWGISNRLLRLYLRNFFNQEITGIGSYGIDIWLATTAITSGAKICESHLGLKIPGASRKMELKLRLNVKTLFERIVDDRKWWAQREIEKTPLIQRLPIFGIRQELHTHWVDINARDLLVRYQHGYNSFHNVYNAILPDDVYEQLSELASGKSDDFFISNSAWSRIIYYFLLAFAFNKEFDRGDLINAGVPLFQARFAGFILNMQSLWEKLSSLPPQKAYELVCLESDNQIEALVDELLLQKQYLLASWEINEEELKPPIPKITYREFIPGVHLVVPLEVNNPKGNPVSANTIYDKIFSRYTAEFDDFIYNNLGIPRDAGSSQIAWYISDFMHKVERLLDSDLLPGNLSTIEGTWSVVSKIIDFFHKEPAFALVPDIAYQILSENPPSELLTRLGYSSLTSLFKQYEPNDALALTSWSEEQEYQEGVFNILRRNIKAEYFESTTLQPVVVNYKQFPSIIEMKECGGLCKLTGRVVVSNLRKGAAGIFPKLRYFSTIGKTVTEMERFGKIWRRWAEEGRELGDKVINSLEGHWGREPLSAHNIFENGHQRLLVQRLREFTRNITETEGANRTLLALAEVLNQAAYSYHLALTLQDGTFIPCSIWTWSSYSSKGGIGTPTPLSLHVERDWSSHDFLVDYYKASGGKEETIDDTIEDLMGQGREYEDLAPILLGTAREDDAIIRMGFIPPQQPPAGALMRYEGNPVLKPVQENAWEAKYVLNPGAIRLEGKVYLVYRAFGEDNKSRLGLAVSEDGFRFTERLEKPIFEPVGKNEEKDAKIPD